MKTKLIPIVAMLGFASAAQADMTLYGLIDMSYGKSIGDDIAKLKDDFHSGGDSGSGEGNSTTRIGIKGGMDAGSGYKMNFKFETGGITSSGEVNPGGAFFNRQAWLGMSGAFGEMRLGRQDSVPFQTMIDYDFNGASNGVSALGYTGVGPWARGRQSRSLQYILPAFVSGLSAQFGLQLKGNGPAGTKDVFSGGIKYTGGPLSGALTFQTKASDTSKDFVAVGGTYDFKVVKVMLGYADGGAVSAGGSGKGPSMGVVANLAGFNLGVQYAQNSDKAPTVIKNAIEVFGNKEIFKNTYAYVEAGQAKPRTGDSGTGYAAGVIFVF